MKIAVPNKGSLAESSIQILKEAGYKQRSDSRDLVLFDAENGVEFYYLRPRDIALYVGTGELQAGITGRDLLIDSGANAEEIFSLDFGASTFRFAGPSGSRWSLKDLANKRIASAYPGLVANYLEKVGLSAEIVRLDGAVDPDTPSADGAYGCCLSSRGRCRHARGTDPERGRRSPGLGCPAAVCGCLDASGRATVTQSRDRVDSPIPRFLECSEFVGGSIFLRVQIRATNEEARGWTKS